MAAVTETIGPQRLAIGGIADNRLFVRSGTTVVGASVSAPLSLAAGVLSIAPVSNTSSGVAPQHAGVSDVGKALIATATGAQWGTDFGANSLTTTGGYISNSATPLLRLGLAPGSGNGSAANTGTMRVARDFALVARNTGDTGDLQIITLTSSGTQIDIGDAGSSFVTQAFVRISNGSIQQRVGSNFITQATSTAFFIGTAVTAGLLFASGNNAPIVGQQTAVGSNVTGAPFTMQAQDMSGGNTVGGSMLSRSGTGTTSHGDYEIRRGNVSGLFFTGTNTTMINMGVFFTGSFQSANKVVAIADRVSAPAGNPTGAMYVWSETGGLFTTRTVAGDILTMNNTQANSATGGAASALPAAPLGYLTWTLNATTVKVPYYAN